MKVQHSDFTNPPDLRQLFDSIAAAALGKRDDHSAATVQDLFLHSVETQVYSRLAAILDGVGDAFCALDRNWHILYANAAAQGFLGQPLETLIGGSIWAILPEPVAGGLKPLCETALLSGDRRATRTEVAAPGGIHLEFNIFSLGDGVGISFRDYSEQRKADVAIRESQAQISAVADNLPLGMVYQMDNGVGFDNRRFMYVSASCERLNGVPAEQVMADPRLLFNLILDEHRERVFRTQLEAHLTQAPFDIEFPIRHAKTGEIRWQRIVDAPRRTPAGSIVWDGIQIDITDHKRAEDHLQLLVNELNHRVKNTLTTVQSLATQSFFGTDSLDQRGLAEARATFEARLFSLARSHDTLTRENWDGACLLDIVRQAVEPYQKQGSGDAFHIAGAASLRISPSLALSVSMALHELCTNALKYGALTAPAGRVQIGWSDKTGDPNIHFVVRWEERDGPPISAPTRRGFGTRLIERLAREFGGTTLIEYPPSGLVCTLEVPFSRTERF